MMNVVFMILCIIVKLAPGLQPSDILDFDGAVSCFFTVYLIPIVLHLSCYYGDNKIMQSLKHSLSVIGLIDEDQDNRESNNKKVVKDGN